MNRDISLMICSSGYQLLNRIDGPNDFDFIIFEWLSIRCEEFFEWRDGFVQKTKLRKN